MVLIYILNYHLKTIESIHKTIYNSYFPIKISFKTIELIHKIWL